ncbi:MAG TPA: GldG family protein [Pelomicrobium sp.]|nr:GldG family protein [Pelomicrobium sp.]
MSENFSRRQLRWRIASSVTIALLVTVAVLAGWAAQDQRVTWDLTQNARHTLSPESREVLAAIEGPVQVTVFATPRDPELGDLRGRIRDFLARYQRAKPDFDVAFVDPEREPRRARDAGIQQNGEMVVAFGERSERFSPLALNEQSFTNLLVRLARRGERTVAYLDGHGERKLTGAANHDLGDFGRRLAATGFRPIPVNLAVVQDVPANAALLVIAGPQVELLRGEVEKIIGYVKRGGNVLWLMEPDVSAGLEPLAERLGLQPSRGVVVDPAAEEMRIPPTWALASGYANHPAVRGFELLTVFPSTRALTANEDSGWRATPLVEAAARGWVEAGPLQGTPDFDPKRDAAGPVTVVIALERTQNEREQRVVVAGGGSFLANAFVGNGANLDLGLRLFNWLGGDERLVTVQPKAARDASLALNRPQAVAITFGWLVAMPALLLAAAVLAWWRRRAL